MSLVARRRALPGLSALVPGLRRRRRRRPRRHPAAAAVPAVARRRRASGCRPSTPPPWPTSATTSPTTATSTRCSGRSRTSTRSRPRRDRLGLRADPRLRPEPHLDRASVVPRAPGVLPLARRRPTTGSASFGGPAWTRARRALLLPRLPARAARPELAQPATCARRCCAVLRFWCERGADGFRIDALRQMIKDDQLARQPAEPGLGRRRPVRRAAPRVHDRPARGAGAGAPLSARRSATGCCSASSTCRSSGSSPTTRRARHAGELPPAQHAVARCRRRRADRALRGRAAARGVAELGARQPRPPARGLARRRRAGRAPRRCSCSPCAARRRSTTATRSGCATSDRARAVRVERRVPGGAAATRRARRCSGARRGFSDGRAVAALRGPGAERGRPARRTPARCSRSTGGCCGCAGTSRWRRTETLERARRRAGLRPRRRRLGRAQPGRRGGRRVAVRTRRWPRTSSREGALSARRPVARRPARASSLGRAEPTGMRRWSAP